MRNKDTDEFIIETNRLCYNNLGELYADGKDDLDILINLHSWGELLDQLSGKNILNVGCGVGDASALLIEEGYSVTNTDLSEEMIAIAKKKCPSASNLVMGATELDRLKDKKFDGIVAIHLIQHLSKNMLLTFFRQVCDLLTDDGKFYLVFTNTCYEKSGCQLEGGAVEGNKIYWSKWKLEDIAPLLVKAKLKPLSVRNQKYVDKDGGYMEPFVIICEKARKR